MTRQSFSKNLETFTAPKLGEHNYLLSKIEIDPIEKNLSQEFKKIFLYKYFLISFLDLKGNFQFFYTDKIQCFFDSTNILLLKINNKYSNFNIVNDIQKFNLNTFDENLKIVIESPEFKIIKKNWIVKNNMIPKFIHFDQNYSFEVKQTIEIDNSLFFIAKLKGFDLF